MAGTAVIDVSLLVPIVGAFGSGIKLISVISSSFNKELMSRSKLLFFEEFGDMIVEGEELELFGELSSAVGGGKLLIGPIEYQSRRK